MTDRQQIAADWAARGFTCDLSTDPPGQRWEPARASICVIADTLPGYRTSTIQDETVGDNREDWHYP